MPSVRACEHACHHLVCFQRTHSILVSCHLLGTHGVGDPAGFHIDVAQVRFSHSMQPLAVATFPPASAFGLIDSAVGFESWLFWGFDRLALYNLLFCRGIGQVAFGLDNRL